MAQSTSEETVYLHNAYITFTGEDEGGTTTGAEKDVEVTQQRDIKSKETFAAYNIL